MRGRFPRQPKVPQRSFHVKKGDVVVVISGAEKGKQGKVLEVQRKWNRVVVEGVRMLKKAVRPSAENPKGGFVEKEAPIHISNVMLVAEYERRKNKRQAAPSGT
ncbi:50S ribosomal protein L24 [Candidatus Methylacidithermus pantelleriae]|uniref:Large ribosomal subunit protein uL24 n=1 Tax=Candidatus Methylacidithermus pantelleriae TaxID=2744239 RepID=A0A8J2FSV0_9BACT|nr:50S ribosomal protein L24 [Candidatus Methylacidithermus pantelleriae]CAF0698868.1 50S ribosomal protein L24 [Candidatus Methylacidithermus pantelleriae]